MRVLPCGRAGLLLELDTLDEVLDLYAALSEQPPEGVLDVVPAARTVLLHVDPAVTGLDQLERTVRATQPRRGQRPAGDLVELPVVYDGPDLQEVGAVTGWGPDGVVERHSGTEWTVAFCGFAPGFGYLTCPGDEWHIPRRDSPRTRVPAGSVALAGEFSAVYPRETPGGWQLIGRTDETLFDLDRDPPALLTPGTRVRFIDTGHRS